MRRWIAEHDREVAIKREWASPQINYLNPLTRSAYAGTWFDRLWFWQKAAAGFALPWLLTALISVLRLL